MSSKESLRWYQSSFYALSYLLFNASSNEHKLQFEMLSKSIDFNNIPELTVLDIGAADGNLTHNLFSNSKKIVAYEANHYLAQLFAKRFETHTDCTLNIIEWTEKTVKDFTFDIISMQHVLYHIEKKSIIEFVWNTLNYLDKDGIVIISLWSEDSESYKIAKNIRATEDWLFTAEKFEKELSKSSLKNHLIDEYLLSPTIKPLNATTSNVILEFLAGNSGFSSKTEYLEKLSNQLLDGINNNQKIFLLKK